MNHKAEFAMAMLMLGVFIGIVSFLLDLELGLVVGLAFGVPTIIYAAIQFSVAADTVGKLVKLEQQLSTRRLDDAPRFISDIVELLKGAKREIIVFCDFPAYGAASDPDGYAKYVDAIRSRVQDVPVKLLFLDEDTQRDLASRFYEDTGNRNVAKRFTSKDQFLGFITEENSRALSDPFRNAERFATSLVMPLYFWIVDDAAVFSLRRFTAQGAVEVGFQTSDRLLVDALKEIFERYQLVSDHYDLVRSSAA